MTTKKKLPKTQCELLYEAACLMSDDLGNKIEYSCFAVGEVSEGGPLVDTYANLMASQVKGQPMATCPEENYEETWLSPGCVEDAANNLKWEPRDFRTFMLLMASEAIKTRRKTNAHR